MWDDVRIRNSMRPSNA